MSVFEEPTELSARIPSIVAAVLSRLIQSNHSRLVEWQQQQHQQQHQQQQHHHQQQQQQLQPKCHFVIPETYTPSTTRFDSAYPPEISIEAYVERVHTYSKVSHSFT